MLHLVAMVVLATARNLVVPHRYDPFTCKSLMPIIQSLLHDSTGMSGKLRSYSCRWQSKITSTDVRSTDTVHVSQAWTKTVCRAMWQRTAVCTLWLPKIASRMLWPIWTCAERACLHVCRYFGSRGSGARCHPHLISSCPWLHSYAWPDILTGV